MRTFGDVRVDLAAERVWRGDEVVDLEPKAFGVLRHLIDHPGRLVSKQELLDDVWHGTAVTDNALTRVVAQLRKALGDDARDARYIETVPTRGYRFIGAMDAPHPSPLPAERGEGAEAVRVRAARPLMPLVAGVLVVAGLVLAAVWLRSPGQTGLATEATEAVPARTRTAGTPSAAASATLDPRTLTQATFSLDVDAYPSFSPDGAMLAYTSLKDGNLDLFVRSFAAGSETRRVTHDSQQNVQPDWSPDGQLLAYHTLARGGVWVVPVSGGMPRQIVEAGAWPRWSPDGRRLAYQTGEVHALDMPVVLAPSTLWLASFSDGERRALTQPGQPSGGHSQPSWSPDGRRLVFVAQHMGPGEIWTIDVVDGTLTRLLACEKPCGTPVLSADGRALFYTVPEPDRGLWRAELSADGRSITGEPELLYAPIDSDVVGLTLRRNGQQPQIAFGLVTVRSNLESIAVDGRIRGPRAHELVSAVTRDTSTRNTWPSISPDGRLVAFTSKRSGVGRHIWLSAPDGTGARQLTHTRTVNLLPTWMPDGQEVAYLTLQNERLELHASSITTGRSRQLRVLPDPSAAARAQLLHARLMPDAGGFVFTRVTNGLLNIWTDHFATDTARQISFDTESAGYPTVSRDGRWIAYEVVRGNNMHIAVVPSAGGESRVITSGRGLFWPHSFSPDGDRLAIAYRRDDGLWRLGWVSRTTGALMPLTAPVPANSFVRYPEWSPSGDRIIYERAQVTGNIWLAPLR
jgi:Tol biopolymer transport system component/DNA-binding winged helix-turn-helix (wHTH) protein